MENEIIAKFTYNKKEYIVFKSENNIEYGYIENGQIFNNLTNDEYNLVNTVYSSFTINKETSVNCGTFKIKNNNINIFYDFTSKLYFFYKIIDNKLKIPSQEELILLNKYYNHQESYICFIETKLDDYPSSRHEMIRRIIKISDKIISITIAATIAFQALPMNAKAVVKYSSDYYLNNINIEKDINEIKYSFDQISQSIKTNDNLTEDEKKYLLNIKTQYEENQNYINQEELYKNLNLIDINYHTNDNGRIAGTYDVIANEINIYKSNNFNDSPKHVMWHEINHGLTTYNIFRKNNFSHDNINYFLEMTNELFSNEYYEEFSKENYRYGYSSHMKVMYPLCEILNAETIKKYRYDPNMLYIINDLMKIDPNIEKATKLIMAINSINLFEEQFMDCEKNEKTQVYNELCENEETIYNLIKHYYNKKYNKDMTEDQIMMLYFKNMGIQEASNIIYNMYSSEDNTVVVTDIIPKGYISEKYKKNYPNIEIVYLTKTGYHRGIIEEKNRYKNIITPVRETKTIINQIPTYNEDGSFEGWIFEEVPVENNNSVYKNR